MKYGPLSTKDVEKIFTNPFYAVNIHPSMCAEHTTMITEEEFIQVGTKLIVDIGAQKYLKLLLENLKGNFLI